MAMKTTVLTFQERKRQGKKISMLTCYDYSTAKLMDQSGIDAVLVGDSLGNVMLGYPDTLSVTMEDMITYGGAVARGCQNTMVVVDMPFMSYQVSVEQAVCNAGRLMQEGRASAVKLEGGMRMADRIRAIVAAGIPVMAHIGMTPQSVHQFGGFKVQGKEEHAAKRLLEDARAVQEAGAFSVVLECVPAPLAELVTQRLDIPTIGIGAGQGCDGQILVYQDMLGLFPDYTPKFVKKFADVGSVMQTAFAAYDEDVKQARFPETKHAFSLENVVLEKLC